MATYYRETIECPPFPKLTWDDYFWRAPDRLSAWAGTQSCRGAYCGLDGDLSDGAIELVVDTGSATKAPTSVQIAAYRYLKDKDSLIARTILQRIFDEYPGWQSALRDFLGEDLLEECMPAISKVEDLRRLVGLGSVLIKPEAEDGIAYCGFEMGCPWEEEHGLGVLMHKERIIDIGQADVAM